MQDEGKEREPMKLKREPKTWPKRQEILQQKQRIIPWLKCVHCKMADTVVRGSIAEQCATGGQFHCDRCGRNHLRVVKRKLLNDGIRQERI
jgi:hypothetical protein